MSKVAKFFENFNKRVKWIVRKWILQCVHVIIIVLNATAKQKTNTSCQKAVLHVGAWFADHCTDGNYIALANQTKLPY